MRCGNFTLYEGIAAAAAAKSLQSCLTLCDPIDGSPPGSPVPGILQARTLEWVAIAFSNAWKWSRSVVPDSQQPHGLQPARLLHPWDFPGKPGVGCHCLLRYEGISHTQSLASPTQWIRAWANSRRWWRTGKPGVPLFMGSWGVRHDWATEQQQQITIYSNIWLLTQ